MIINPLISDFFKYERDVMPNRQAMIDKMLNTSHPKSRGSNVSVYNDYYDCAVQIPYLENTSKGVIIAVYSAEKSLHWIGPMLPAPLEKYCDSPYVYYGTLLSAMAVLLDKKVNKLILVDTTQDSSDKRAVSISHRPDIGARFLDFLCGKEEKPAPIITHHKQQDQLNFFVA